MIHRRTLPAHVRRLFRLPRSPSQIDRELRDEFAFHIDGRVEQLVQQGMARRQAEVETRARFGDYDAHWEHTRRIDEDAMLKTRRLEFGALLWNEVQHSARALRRSPGFSIIAIITLALGIGATTAIYAVLDSVVLRPLPYHNAGELVSVLHPATVTGSGERKWGLSAGGYLQFRKQTRTLAGLGMYRSQRMTITNSNRADIARIGVVTASLMTTLGARAEAGRMLLESDDQAGRPVVAVLSHEYLVRRFGGDTSIIGRNIETDRGPIEVVGVAEPGLTLPMPGPFASQANLAGFGVDVWLPLQLNTAGPFYNSHPYVGIGRLRNGVTVEAAQREFAGIMASFTDSLPLAYSTGFMKGYNFRVEVSELRNAVLGPTIPRALWMVLGSVVLVLLIAAANAANLFIVRMETRRRESTIRTALGASHTHMAAHFMSESLLLSAIAALAGTGIAYAGLRGLLMVAPASVPRLASLTLGSASVAVAMGIALTLGAALGAIPLFRRFSTAALREGGRGLSNSPRQRRVRNALVIGQVALAVVLVAAAGLMTRSFMHLRNVKPGFDAANVTAFNISLPFTEYDTREKAFVFHRELQREIGELPGVASVGTMGQMLLEDFGVGCAVIYHETGYTEGEKPPCVPVPSVGAGFFEALHVPVVGRAPGWNDLDQRLHTVVVTKALADRMWPGADAIGKRVNNSGPQGPTWYTVIGVVSGLRAESLEEAPTEAAFFARSGFSANERTDAANDLVYFVRTRSTATPALMERINALVSRLNPRVPVVNARTMEQVVQGSMARTSFIMILLAVAASVALALSTVGMYGVISYVVAQRRVEIGIRMALGAGTRGVTRLIVWQSFRLALAGVAFGIAGAFLMGRSMSALLFGVRASDPVTLTAVSLLLLFIAACASLVPARRAACIDPLLAMRSD